MIARATDTARRVTLALGGGGARGLSHLGVIETLLDAGYQIEQIVGVSIGSLAGAMFAFNPDIRAVQRQAADYLLSPTFQRHQQVLFAARRGHDDRTGGVFAWYSRARDYLRANRLFHRVILRPSLLPGIVLNDVVNALLPEADIRDAKVPFAAVAADLISGERVVLERGPVREAVRASSSLPGIFPPVAWEDMLLTDVGVLYSLPSTIARSYSSGCVVAVDVGSAIRPLKRCETALDVLIRMDEIGETILRKYVRRAADVVIQPAVGHIEWFDFSTALELIECGRTAAKRVLPALDAFFAGRLSPADPLRTMLTPDGPPSAPVTWS